MSIKAAGRRLRIMRLAEAARGSNKKYAFNIPIKSFACLMREAETSTTQCLRLDRAAPLSPRKYAMDRQGPPTDAQFRVHTEVFSFAAELTARGRPFAVATVFATEGSASASVGSKAIIDDEGAILAGWVGGGCAQSTVAHAAIDSIETGEGQVVDLDLNDEVLGTGMPCGGSMKVFVDPVRPQPTLWILGHGRIAECLCCLGALMGFEVVVDDPQASRERYPDAARLLTDDDNYRSLAPTADDFAVVATQHKGDHQSMCRLLQTDVAYIGLIASHKRSQLVFDYLRERGIDEDGISRVRAPAGLDLLARSPEEIALSVISEIVRKRNASREKHAAGDGQSREGGNGEGGRDRI